MAPAGAHPTFADIVGVLQELQAQVDTLRDKNAAFQAQVQAQAASSVPTTLHPFSVSPSCPYPVSFMGIVPNDMGSLTIVISSSCCGQSDPTAQFQVELVLSLF